MSDEFFFDDDAVEEKGAKKKAAPKKAPSKASNGKKNETTKSDKKPAAKNDSRPAKNEAPADGAIAPSWTLIIMVAVIGLLVGAIGGIFIGRSLAPKVVYDSSSINTGNGMESMMGGSMGGTSTDGSADGEMPAGHPDISTMGGSGTDAGTSGN